MMGLRCGERVITGDGEAMRVIRVISINGVNVGAGSDGVIISGGTGEVMG